MAAYRARRAPEKPRPQEPPSQAAEAAGPQLIISVWADGEPVAGAKISVQAANGLQRAHTDADGLVKLDGCAAGPIATTVEAAGFVRVERASTFSPDGSLERIDLEPGEQLEGSVVDESDKPVPGATVTVRVLGPTATTSNSSPWLAVTTHNGSFAVRTLPSAHVVVDVSDGGAHEVVSLTDVGLPSPPLHITLRRTAAMSGSVVSEDGEAVGGAAVTLVGSGVWPPRVQQTDPAGAFSFADVPEGIYELRAELGSAVSAPLEGVAVQPGSHAKIELVLAPGAKLHGFVRTAASGAPLRAELRVAEEALSGRERTAQTRPDGSFEVVGLRPLPHRVTISSPGYVAEQRWLTPGTPPAMIELLRAAAASGRVEDSDGNPVPYADIEVKGRSVTGKPVLMLGAVQEAPAPPVAPLGATEGGENLGITNGAVPRVPIMTAPDAVGQSGALGYHSDAQGHFLIDGLPPGQFTLTARKVGMSAGRSSTLQLRAGATLQDVVIVLPAGVALHGRVEDARGSVVSHVRVDLVCGTDVPRSTTTRADGSFAFLAARGECSLWARPFGAPAAKLTGQAAELAGQEILIKLDNNSERLRGRVVDSGGRPIASASVRLEAQKSHGYTPTVLTAADGSFEFAGLPPPPYLLNAEHPDWSPSFKQTVETTRDPAEIRLKRGATLRGTVRDALTGQPLSAAEVIVRAAVLVRVARISRDGAFVLQHLPEGPFRVSAACDGYITATVDGQLDEASPAPREVQLELAKSASISGEVVDSLGRTVWNAQVSVGAPPDWSRATRTDHSGHFLLADVPKGEHVVSARHGALLATSETRIRVVEGAETPGAVVRLPAVVEDEPEVRESARAAPAQPSGPLAFAMRGAVVILEHVASESLAARAGLQKGDVLLSVDGEPVRSAAQARGMLGVGIGRRTSWTLQVRRDQKTLVLRYPPR